jgi:hypothetical protein
MAYNNAVNINGTGIVNADGSGGFNGSNLDATGNTISSTDTNGNVVLDPDGTGTVSITTAPIVPSGDRADSLGSATNSWDNVYADGLSFDDGSNVMATYETGTFTPTFVFSGGSTGITFSQQVGSYIKIGNLVQFDLSITLTSKGTSTGNASVGGLSFTPSGVHNGTMRHKSFTFTGDGIIPLIRDAGGFDILFQAIGSGATLTNLTDTAIANNSAFTISGLFTV